MELVSNTSPLSMLLVLYSPGVREGLFVSGRASPRSSMAWSAAVLTGEKSVLAKYFNCEEASTAYGRENELLDSIKTCAP